MSSKDKQMDNDPVVSVVLDSDRHEVPKVSWGQRILYSLWDSDQHLKSPQERAFVRKLDFAILTCATLGVSVFFLDTFFSHLFLAYLLFLPFLWTS